MLFDDQAARFDQRAGLPGGVPAQVARAVAAMSGVDRNAGLLDMGAGTGEIGIHLARLPCRYIGLDLSIPMLLRFRERPGFAHGGSGPQDGKRLLAQADGDAPWPLADGSLDAVFGSRSLHFIRPAHLAAESKRVAGPRGLSLLLGKVERDPDSVKERMRRQMRWMLGEKGHQGRGGRKGREVLWNELAALGAQKLEPRHVARWKTASSPRRSLQSWVGKKGLAGLALQEPVKQEVLEGLESWAMEEFGSLDREIESEESYTLEGMVFR